MNNNRVQWIDVVKWICISFVMMHHWEGCSSTLNEFFNPFFLMAFFFCSGYCYKTGLTFKDFIAKKFYQLIIPWFIYSNANILLSSIKSYKEHSPLLTELLKNLLQIRGYGDLLWFLTSLFVAYLFFYYIIEKSIIKNNFKKVFLLYFVLYLGVDIYAYLLPVNTFYWNSYYLPWHLDYIPQAGFYILLGYIYRTKLENKINKYENRKTLLVIFTVYVFMVYGVNLAGLDIVSVIFVSIFKIIRHIFGIALIVLISKMIKPNKYIEFIGSNTLLYFAMHNKIQTFLEVVLSKMVPNIYNVILINEPYSFVFGFIFVTMASLLLIIPCIFVGKYFPWTMGRKRVQQ